MDSKLQAAENQQQQGQQQHAGQPKGNPVAELNKIGGFGFVESVVDGIANMNPPRKASVQNLFRRIPEAGLQK